MIPAETIISPETGMQLVTVIVLVTAGWKISWLLSRIDSRTDGLPEKVAKLEKAQSESTTQLALLNQKVEMMEGDVNNLWAEYRGGSPEQARREPRPPRAGKP